MSNIKKKIIDKIIEAEGGYVNNPSDSGGETNFGITCKVAKENGYHGAMRDLPRKLAFHIYTSRYWESVRGTHLLLLSEPIAAEVVDTAVHAGQGMASYFLQRSLNVLNRGESIYPDLSIDRSIGFMTIAALEAYLKVRDEHILVRMLNVLQGAYYVELAERREKDEKFIYGWFKNRVTLDAGGGVPSPPKPKSGDKTSKTNNTE